jgi:Protein of unknown function (DUF2950)
MISSRPVEARSLSTWRHSVEWAVTTDPFAIGTTSIFYQLPAPCLACALRYLQTLFRMPGASNEFAQKLVSDKGGHNGLYWDEAYNQFDTPISPLIAYAS